MPGVLLSSAATTYPTPWVIAASVLTGAAISLATRRTRAAPDPEAARTRKWVLAVTLLCCALLVWLLAIFVPGPERIATPKYLFFYLAASVVFAVGLRFPKTAGLPLLVLLTAAGAFGCLLATGLASSGGEPEIGRIVAYRSRDGIVEIEVRLDGRDPEVVELAGDRVVPLVTSVFFDDLWPVLGWRSWHRTEGVTALRVAGGGGSATLLWAESPLLFEPPTGASERLWSEFVEVAHAIPGVRVVRSEELAASTALEGLASGGVEELVEYAVRLEADGGVRLVAVSEGAGGAE